MNLPVDAVRCLGCPGWLWEVTGVTRDVQETLVGRVVALRDIQLRMTIEHAATKTTQIMQISLKTIGITIGFPIENVLILKKTYF